MQRNGFLLAVSFRIVVFSTFRVLTEISKKSMKFKSLLSTFVAFLYCSFYFISRTKMSSKAKKGGSKSKEKGSSDKKEKKEKKKEGEAEVKASESTTSLNPSDSTTSLPPNPNQGTGATGQPDYSMLPFEAGQIFSKYDYDGDGKLNKHEFTELVRNNIDLLRATPSAQSKISTGNLPTEIVSNRILTHFDETAGIAIARQEVDQHSRMGNVVTPLVDAYKSRYERLRALLTGKMFPKREHLLQLRRQLQHSSAEVDAKRRSIERETLSDTEQILERLRNVESMRQASIRHQIIQIEDELQSMERVIRRVERANIEESQTLNNNGISLVSAAPGSIPVESIRIPKATSMVEVIHEFGDLSSIIENIAMKPITVQVDFPTDDFPKETSERLEVISRCDRYVHALNVKDHMLYTALQERDKFEKALSDERRLSQEYAQEVANWADMTQTLTHQLAASKQDNDALQRKLYELTDLLRRHNIYHDLNL